MKTFASRCQFMLPTHSNLAYRPKQSPFLISTRPESSVFLQKTLPKSEFNQHLAKTNYMAKSSIFDVQLTHKSKKSSTMADEEEEELIIPTGYSSISRHVIVGAVSIGFVMLLMGIDDAQKALALGPGGPLVEEFWDNMRRYGLYVLTVSTGVLYAVFEPIVGLLKNPVSAILILVILGGGFYIVSQVVSAMVGNTDFSYQYTY